MKNRNKGDNGEGKDCPLTFPDLTVLDHTRICPRYASVLQRKEDLGIGIEEVDTLQAELESLLASAAKRMRVLETESNILQNWAEKAKDGDKPVAAALSTSVDVPCMSPGKRSLPKDIDEKVTPSKKFKDSFARSVLTTPTRNKLPLRPKSDESLSPESPTSPVEVVQKIPAKTDAPSRFWNLVEPYCAEITTDDLKVLEDIMQLHNDVSDLVRVPALGKSFVHRWFKEDKNFEEKEGLVESKASVTKSTGKLVTSTKQNGNNSAKGKSIKSDKAGFGPLTQRLIQALMEENVMASPDDAVFMEDDGNAASISPQALAQQLNIGNSAALEKRIRQELEEQGLLDLDGSLEDSADEDEILRELKKRQQELAVVSEQNFNMAKHLIDLAKEEMRKQDLRKKLAAADAEVLDLYKKLQIIKQRKKMPTKKERDAVWKALHDREELAKQLNT